MAECEECLGHGEVDCDECEASGLDANGYDNCENCGGSGGIECGACAGSGETS